MASKKDKKPFEWKAGSKLTSDQYDAVPEVREAGFSKLADGIKADPVERRKDRKTKLTRQIRPKKAGEVVIEESVSGLQGDYTPSEASRLIHKDRELKGIQRFRKKSPNSSDT